MSELSSAQRALHPVCVVGVITAASAAMLAGAWYSEVVMGLLPCKLCLEQRWPHYFTVTVGLVLLALLLVRPSARPPARPHARPRAVLGAAPGLLALVMAVSALMGGYHAGVEWGWFAGPSDCGGAAASPAGSMQDFLRQLQTTRVVSCTEAAFRFLGLSLAGWNGLISLILAAYAALAAVVLPPRAG